MTGEDLDHVLRAAVSAARIGDPAGVAVELARAAALCRGGPRQRRQQVEIVSCALAGDEDRARALAGEHLAEFDDKVIAALLDATDPTAAARSS